MHQSHIQLTSFDHSSPPPHSIHLQLLSVFQYRTLQLHSIECRHACLYALAVIWVIECLALSVQFRTEKNLNRSFFDVAAEIDRGFKVFIRAWNFLIGKRFHQHPARTSNCHQPTHRIWEASFWNGSNEYFILRMNLKSERSACIRAISINKNFAQMTGANDRSMELCVQDSMLTIVLLIWLNWIFDKTIPLQQFECLLNEIWLAELSFHIHVSCIFSLFMWLQ